ncbi:MAG: DUF1178 family protein [Pseudomonadota bacterium]
MIKYNLLCAADHEFEGWFRSSDDFAAQSRDGLLECPACGSDDVRKAIMAPAIARPGAARRDKRLAEIKESMSAAVTRARDYVEKNFDYVGEKFPEEARRIHYGETEKRGIYGEASGKEVKDLVSEGVEIAPLPGLKSKEDKAGAPIVEKADKKKLN